MAIYNNAINANANTPLKTLMGGLGISNPTAHGILVGEGANAVNPIVLGSGQILIGVNGADPVAATITSTGGSVAVASSNGGINLEVNNVSVSHGGTGLTSVTQNAILYGNGTSALGTFLLAPNQIPFGSSSGSPTYASLTSADGSHNITYGANSIDFALNNVSVAKGGTGVSSLPAHSILIGNGTNAIKNVSLTDGQLLIGSTGNDPVPATLIAGMGVSITSASGSVTISANNQMPFEEDTASKQMTASPMGYIANGSSSAVIYTLPTSCAQGVTFEIVGKGSMGWKVAQNSGQVIYFGNTATTSGSSGFIASTQQRDTVEILCITANSEFQVVSSVGNIDVE